MVLYNGAAFYNGMARYNGMALYNGVALNKGTVLYNGAIARKWLQGGQFRYLTSELKTRVMNSSNR